MPPHHYVICERINESQKLLATRRMSGHRGLPWTLGFASQSHFTEVFRKVTGTNAQAIPTRPLSCAHLRGRRAGICLLTLGTTAAPHATRPKPILAGASDGTGAGATPPADRLLHFSARIRHISHKIPADTTRSGVLHDPLGYCSGGHAELRPTARRNTLHRMVS